MEILAAIGLNSTVVIQVGVFLLAYLFASKLIFGPYLKAFVQREELTVGSEETAEKTEKEIADLTKVYETRVRELNTKIQKIFDAARSEAVAEQTSKITQARKDAETTVNEARANVKIEKDKARAALASSLKTLSSEVVTKLLEKGR